ncbi:MAG: winged helix DNA-binding protein [Roseiarcus sp.]
MAAAGVQELSPLDGLVPHTISHRDRKKKLVDICLVLNIEDTRVVAYALKNLERLKLIERERIGKGKAVAITPTGEAVCLKHREIREALLVKAVRATGFHEATISNLAVTMRALSGQCDQAARAAASL